MGYIFILVVWEFMFKIIMGIDLRLLTRVYGWYMHVCFDTEVTAEIHHEERHLQNANGHPW